jgi:hypothetical protein
MVWSVYRHNASRIYNVRFHFLLTASVKMAVFWFVALCILAEV